jgi:hypothetical protein
MSSFFLNSGSAGFLPKHMIPGAIHSDTVQLAMSDGGGRDGEQEGQALASRTSSSGSSRIARTLEGEG